MSCPLKSISIADGVSFNSVIDERFKTNKISINFINELNDNTVTTNAIIPYILKKGHNDSSDFTIFNRELEELYGAYVSAYVQKVGDYQILSLSITSIDDKFTLNHDSVTEKTSSILCNMALNPILENGVFRLDEVELEKTALIDTIDSEINEKRIYAINNLVKLMCNNEPFGIPKYGLKEKVDSMTPELIKESYDNLIRNARIEIMFTGCGDDNIALGVFSNAFKNTKRNYSNLNAISTHRKQDSIVEKTDKLSVNQSKMVLGFANELAGDDKLVTATKLAVAVLGGTPSAKLFVNVREKLSLCYYCAARYDRFKGIMMIDCGVESKNIDMARKEILVQVDCIKAGEITDEEMNNAVLSLKNALTSIHDSDSSIESWYLGQILGGTNISPKQESDKLEGIDKNSVIEAANRINLDAVYILTGNEVE